jgi:regulator of protease activity HflC (stomatin/prohibitin superfamily)
VARFTPEWRRFAGDPPVLSSFLIFVLFLALVALVTVYAGVKIVPQGSVWTVERFGRYRTLLHPGLNIIVPYMDSIGRRINMMESVLPIPSQGVITKDNASVEVDGIVFYTVFDAGKAAYAVQNLQQAIVNVAMTNIRTAIGSMDLDETLSNRERINTMLLHVLDLATEVWGTKVNRVELKDVQPPIDVVASMAKQLAADREARAAILQADGFRKAAVLKAEGEKQSVILAAEGRLVAAERDAQARERLAAAEAEATRVVSLAVEAGSTAALNYFIAQRYTDALTRIGSAPNSKLVMIPLEAAGIAGSLAGMTELIKESFQPRSDGPSPRGRPASVPGSGVTPTELP